MLEVHWERFEQSSHLYGPWEDEVRRRIDDALPGTSQRHQSAPRAPGRSPEVRLAVAAVRPPRRGSDRSSPASSPSCIPRGRCRCTCFRHGKRTSGRSASSCSAIRPTRTVRTGLIARARDGVLVLRDLHQLPASLQREIAAALRSDLDLGLGPRLRWIATTEDDPMSLVSEGLLDATLFGLFEHPLRLRRHRRASRGPSAARGAPSGLARGRAGQGDTRHRARDPQLAPEPPVRRSDDRAGRRAAPAGVGDPVGRDGPRRSPDRQPGLLRRGQGPRGTARRWRSWPGTTSRR